MSLRKLVWDDLSPRRTNALLAVLIVLIGCAMGDVLVANWRSDDQRASLEAGNISAAISQDILRNVELFDLSIRGAAEDMVDPDVLAASGDIRRLILFDRAASASYLGQIIVIGPTGDLVASSGSEHPKPQNYGDRDYFRIHAEQPDFGLYVSRPLLSRSEGKLVVVFSRRITNQDGSFGGVVAGTLLIDYLHQLFRQIKLGPNGSLTLFRNDGSIIMREPFDAALIGARHVPNQLFDMANRMPEGELRARSVVDGVQRLFHFRRLGDLPLITSVGFATADIHRDWWWRTMLIGSVVAASCGLIVLLNVRLSRALRSRIAAEAALMALVDKDGLTGLGNRRCFDRVLQAEWSRALRHGQPLALLMIDVDHFKAFNDCLGHASGDAALCHLAKCLALSAGRAGDLAARYGGEEFALILPGLNVAAACLMAEDLRQAVLALGLSHPGSPLAQLTVSIGCASADPATGGSPEALCAAADDALYRSKRGGRNRVSGAAPPFQALRRAS